VVVADHHDYFGLAIVVPLQGTGGIYGPSCHAVAELAAHEINQADGILGRRVELIFIDAGRRPEVVGAEIAELVRVGVVDAITGWHISPVRDAIFRHVQGAVPYVYTALYEGGEARPGVFSSGEIPFTQVAPALYWLRRQAGVRDWVIVGHDYSWPRRSASFIRQIADRLDVQVLGADYAPMDDERAVLRLVDRVDRSAAGGVLMFFVGQDAVIFNREFARRGLTQRMVRYSPLMDESMLMGSGLEATENLFASAGYFRSLVTPATMDLQSRYAAFHGEGAPALSNTAESMYEGIATLFHLHARARTTEMSRINGSVVGLAYDGPRGVVEYHGPQGRHDVYLARADGFDFEVLTGL